MWSAQSYLEHFFIGQTNIINEISPLVDSLVDDINLNFLFRAPSGYGKTYLATCIVNFLRFKQKNGTYQYHLGNITAYNPNKRIQIIDEVHLLKEPESIYPLIDSSRHTFILCSNEYDELLEPLINRCFIFNFDYYSNSELEILTKKFFIKKEKPLPESFIIMIVNRSRLNPREVLLLCKRLYLVFRLEGVPENEIELSEILDKNIGTSEGGFTNLDLRYLEFLNIHSRASLNTLSSVLRIPKTTIMSEIEPFLIRKGLITISPRGRMLL